MCYLRIRWRNQAQASCIRTHTHKRSARTQQANLAAVVFARCSLFHPLPQLQSLTASFLWMDLMVKTEQEFVACNPLWRSETESLSPSNGYPFTSSPASFPSYADCRLLRHCCHCRPSPSFSPRIPTNAVDQRDNEPRCSCSQCTSSRRISLSVLTAACDVDASVCDVEFWCRNDTRIRRACVL